MLSFMPQMALPLLKTCQNKLVRLPATTKHARKWFNYVRQLVDFHQRHFNAFVCLHCKSCVTDLYLLCAQLLTPP